MKKDKNVWIFVGVMVVLIVVLLVVRNNNKNKKGQEVENQTQVTGEEYVNVLSDGTKINTSDKLAETKVIDGLEISNIRLTEKNNISKILATVKNSSNQTKGGYKIKITLLDKNSNTIKEIESYIDQVEPGETVTLNTAATVDFANAYDFTVTKK